MSKNTYLSGSYATGTDTGKIRLSNEDRVGAFVNTKGNVLLIVCDGMGGQNKGEYAASIALTCIKEAFLKKGKFHSKLDAAIWLRRVVTKANKEIFNESGKKDNYKGMGTTLTAVLIVKDIMFVIQVGDSRAYALRNRNLEQITEDQSYVYYLYRTGKITEEEMKTHPKRHVLMNALGIFPSVDFEFKRINYMGETIMVCSDGLYNNVSSKNIASILKGDDSTEQKVNELIALANANGGSDNIAIALWESNQ
jgi:protein phosphatase